MTVQEAIKYLKDNKERITAMIYVLIKDLSIKALKKQIPKKVAYKPQDTIYQRPYCPTCDKELFDDNYSVGYCECGQKIDWEVGGIE